MVIFWAAPFPQQHCWPTCSSRACLAVSSDITEALNDKEKESTKCPIICYNKSKFACMYNDLFTLESISSFFNNAQLKFFLRGSQGYLSLPKEIRWVWGIFLVILYRNFKKLNFFQGIQTLQQKLLLLLLNKLLQENLNLHLCQLELPIYNSKIIFHGRLTMNSRLLNWVKIWKHKGIEVPDEIRLFPVFRRNVVHRWRRK